MASRRLQKRIEAEAAEKQGKTAKAPKKRAASKRTTTARKRKVKAPERKKLYWGVFSGTLKEEGRFAYDELDKAEERLAQLRSKSKKLYFIQPIKVTLSESGPVDEAALPQDEDPEDEVVAVAEEEEDEEEAEEEEDVDVDFGGEEED